MLIDQPEPVNLDIHQGTSNRFEIFLEDSDNEPVDLTDWSAELNISRERRRPPRWAWSDTTQAVWIPWPPTAGRIVVRLLPATTLEFAQLENLAYDLIVTDPVGVRTLIMTGTLRVRGTAGATA